MMQAIHGNKEHSFKDALQLERNGELEAAAAIYRSLHKAAPGNLKILARMIIVYRKLKDVGNEIRYLNAAIKVHESHYTPGKNANKKVAEISRQLNDMLGYAAKKGKAAFKPDELLKLEIRRNKLLDKMPGRK
ncbi:MAG TPA: hypothetical protein VHL77_11190 [Ferruginibacter sp.]|jgi:hypothetical protein|nr:hypothetical protein [Ferruginibacter sp.]